MKALHCWYRPIELMLLCSWLAGCPAESAPQDKTAQASLALGMALASAPEVSIEQLFREVKQWEGKTVRVSGEVQDFCFHRRAWFGISSKDGSRMMRVFTAPRFEAPTDCVGKHAVAEGKVEVMTLQPEDLKHYAHGHKFLTESEIQSTEPVLMPIIRAFGAEFRNPQP